MFRWAELLGRSHDHHDQSFLNSNKKEEKSITPPSSSTSNFDSLDLQIYTSSPQSNPTKRIQHQKLRRKRRSSHIPMENQRVFHQIIIEDDNEHSNSQIHDEGYDRSDSNNPFMLPQQPPVPVSPPPVALTASSSCSLTATPTVSSSSERMKDFPGTTTTTNTTTSTAFGLRTRWATKEDRCRDTSFNRIMIQRRKTFLSRLRNRRTSRLPPVLSSTVATANKSQLFRLPSSTLLWTVADGKGYNADDGKPPLMKTRLRIEQDGGVETFYYNTHELEYSDDGDENDEQQPIDDWNFTSSLSLPPLSVVYQSAFCTNGGCCHSEGGGNLTTPTEPLSFHHDDNNADNSDDCESQDWEDDSLEGSMYFVNNESKLLELSVQELLVNPHRPIISGQQARCD